MGIRPLLHAACALLLIRTELSNPVFMSLLSIAGFVRPTAFGCHAFAPPSNARAHAYRIGQALRGLRLKRKFHFDILALTVAEAKAVLMINSGGRTPSIARVPR